MDVDNLLQYGGLGLFVLAFIESVFFPIPPDVLLLPLSLMSRSLSFWYAFLTTMASVFGAVFGYFLGRKLGRPLLFRFMKKEKMSDLEQLFKKYGGWAVGVAAFTPIPYKVFTIAGGIFNVSMTSFLLASFIGRGARFFLEAAFLFFLGEKAQALLGGKFEILTLLLTVVVVLAVVLLHRFSKKRFSLRFPSLFTRVKQYLHQVLLWFGCERK